MTGRCRPSSSSTPGRWSRLPRTRRRGYGPCRWFGRSRTREQYAVPCSRPRATRSSAPATTRRSASGTPPTARKSRRWRTRKARSPTSASAPTARASPGPRVPDKATSRSGRRADLARPYVTSALPICGSSAGARAQPQRPAHRGRACRGQGQPGSRLRRGPGP